MFILIRLIFFRLRINYEQVPEFVHPLAPILEAVESHVPLFVQFSLLPYPHTVEFVQLVFVDTAKFELNPPLIAPNPPEIRPSAKDLIWVMKD